MKRHRRGLLLGGALAALFPNYLWPYTLGGASAAPTILLGDQFVVNQAAYDLRAPFSRTTLVRWNSPKRGDIVVADLPAHVGRAIKRVVGLPGEAIEIRENRVLIDGRILPLETADPTEVLRVPPVHRMGSTIVIEDGHRVAYTPGAGRYRNLAPVTLSAAEYFLLGDNRDESLDSRAFGPVTRDKILGKVIAVIPTGKRLDRR